MAKKIKVEMNTPPKKTKMEILKERQEQSDLEFLANMLEQIENQRPQIVAQLEQLEDYLRTLDIDYKHTKSLFEREKRRMERLKRK